MAPTSPPADLSGALALRFLGVGNARASALGSASAVLESAGTPRLLIDCGPRTLDDYAAQYAGALPSALYLSHLHMDHIGGVEQLFYRTYFEDRGRVRLFVPCELVPALHYKLANSPFVLSEGGANFWDAFRLVPAGDSFWLDELLFRVFPVRHSGYRAAFGLLLPGAFLYSGDTRPIRDVIERHARAGELLFHDCGLHGSPAHAGLEDLQREYPPEMLRRVIAYHYESADAGAKIAAAGLRIAQPGVAYPLPVALPITAEAAL
ncbi:MAG TPA: MBL fold metallo-hydrolase [Gammaproteobacteria bacterium]|nr:MBL fold metallo-hydrolase [Gammaproteobacteria bacterium]